MTTNSRPPKPSSSKQRPFWATILIVTISIVIYVAKQKQWIPSDADSKTSDPPVATTPGPTNPQPGPREAARPDPQPKAPSTPSRVPHNESSVAGDTAGVAKCFEAQRSYKIVTDGGRVVHLLPDDTDTADGSGRHQKFLVDVSRGITIRLVNNIDPGFFRVPVREGDTVRFKGEYIYNEKGGTVHWTHHDPTRRHADGWVELNGKKYD